MSYSVSQVENLTGVKAHTLRVWERRYSFLRPERTSTNIRYYTDEQLRKLLRIGMLTRNGHRISAVDQMSDERINELVTELVSTHAAKDEDIIDAFVLSMIKMDEDDFNVIYNQQVAIRGFLRTVTELIYPFLILIGGLWTTEKANPAQEHFVTNLIRQKILSAIEGLPHIPAYAPRILMFLLEGDNHEIGLLLAQFIAKQCGWKVIYLGHRVPFDNLSPAIDISQPQALMTMFVTPRPSSVNRILTDITALTDIPILVSGTQTNFEKRMDSGNVYYLSNPMELVTYLLEHKDSETAHAVS